MSDGIPVRYLPMHQVHPVVFYQLPIRSTLLDEGRAPNHTEGRYRVWFTGLGGGWKGEPAVLLKVDVEGQCGDVYDARHAPCGVLVRRSDLIKMLAWCDAGGSG